jgi:hypothetical protein
MPGMDGIELVRELAKRGANVPVVLISGHADVQMAVAGIKAGAEDFIEKPVDDSALVAAINRGLTRIFARQVRQQSGETLTRQFADAAPNRDLDLAPGFTSHAIAGSSSVPHRRSYRAQIMEKMQASVAARPAGHQARPHRRKTTRSLRIQLGAITNLLHRHRWSCNMLSGNPLNPMRPLGLPSIPSSSWRRSRLRQCPSCCSYRSSRGRRWCCPACGVGCAAVLALAATGVASPPR